MPILKGFFNHFSNTDAVSIQNIKNWLNNNRDVIFLENQLGNRVIYPEAVPLNSEDVKFNTAIIREIIRLQPKKYFKNNPKRIFIPDILLEYIPNLEQLCLIFIDILNPLGYTEIFLEAERLGVRVIGSLIKPKIQTNNGMVKFTVNGKDYTLKIGSLILIPVSSGKTEVEFKTPGVTLFENNSALLEASGGHLGIVIDTRK